MTRFVVSIIGGASLGGTYALVALGIVLAFRATSTFNFAHGEFMLFPAFIVGRWQAGHHGTLAIGVLLALLVISMIGVLFYATVLQRTTGLARFMGVIATFGLAAVLDGVMLILFGPSQYDIRLPGLHGGVVRIAGARIATNSIVLTIFTLSIAAAVAVGLRYTRVGLRVRAAGQDPLLASQGGINVRRLYMGSWALAGLLAGIAGIAYGSTNIVGTDMVNVALAAFPAILIGGLDSIEGAIVGGLAVGIFQGFVATYLGGEMLDVLTYSLLLVVMLAFPEGLFGTRRVARV